MKRDRTEEFNRVKSMPSLSLVTSCIDSYNPTMTMELHKIVIPFSKDHDGAALESIGAIRSRITERSRAGDHLGDEATGRGAKRQPPMSVTEGEP